MSGLSDESSEDEPLINLVKKRGTKNKMKAPKKRNATPKKQRKIHESGKDSGSASLGLVEVVEIKNHM